MIPFTKAHACGNDFLIVTEEAAEGYDWAGLTRRLCARNTGIGADGIEFFAWTGRLFRPHPAAQRRRLHRRDQRQRHPLRGRVDGASNAAAQPGDNLRISTDAGVRVCHVNAIHADGEYTVKVTTGMGVPSFAPRTVVLADGTEIDGVEVSTGNPHFVIVVDNPEFTVARQSHGRRSARRYAFIPISLIRPTSSFCVSWRATRSRFASSSAAWDRRLLLAPAVPLRPLRHSR